MLSFFFYCRASHAGLASLAGRAGLFAQCPLLPALRSTLYAPRSTLYAPRSLDLFIKISDFFIYIIPGVYFFPFMEGVQIEHGKIPGAHCCMNEQKKGEAPFPQTGKGKYKKKGNDPGNCKRCPCNEPELFPV